MKNIDHEKITDNISAESVEYAVAAETRKPWPVRVWRFYVEGFKQMTVGKYLWAIIIVKVAILFLVFKLLLFPNILEKNYDNDEDRAAAVRENLTRDVQ